MEDDINGDRRRTQAINDIQIHAKQIDFEWDDVKIDGISVCDHILQTYTNLALTALDSSQSTSAPILQSIGFISWEIWLGMPTKFTIASYLQIKLRRI